jgi:carboxynorspermidine decarboxylase
VVARVVADGELGSDALERTLAVVEEKFDAELRRVQWVNFGGGHHITRPDYDVERLVRIVKDFRARRGLEVYLEPGEAIAINTGILVSSVLDVTENSGIRIAILDTSATAHMPDVLEMPYRPVIVGAGRPGEHPHTVRLGGLTCLAGDVIGDYSFPRPLAVGDKLVFADMAHYTMVKNTTFNGVRLPSIALHDPATRSCSAGTRSGSSTRSLLR